MTEGSSRYTTANGNRWRKNLRVPRIPADQRCGASEIKAMARSRSAANLEAALGFRSKYHWKAASYSRAAASWNSTSLLAMRQSGRNPVTDLFPRNCLCFAGVQFGDAASDLLVPCGLSAWVRGTVEAVHQRTSQVCAFLLGEGESLPEEILSLLSHGVIIPLVSCLRSSPTK